MKRKSELQQLPIDPTLRGKANVTQDELRELGRLCRVHGVSEASSYVLARMASYPPHIRLAVNLKTLIGLLTQDDKPKYSVLTDGLLPDERSTLVELDLKGLSSHAREIAHGLFNVHERWFLMKQLRRLFRGAFKAKEEYISPKVEDEDAAEA
jgi:hypothetical protein